MEVKLHDAAIRVTADAIGKARYLAVSVSDEDLARMTVTIYKENVPNRSRVTKPTT